mmetsp:Transcript_24328/g.53575  ORF Transcript_24328/g.53575 Transcript_24328/m.53575 type:complete len:201 (-) Transcript_24328:189-791(-)
MPSSKSSSLISNNAFSASKRHDRVWTRSRAWWASSFASIEIASLSFVVVAVSKSPACGDRWIPRTRSSTASARAKKRAVDGEFQRGRTSVQDGRLRPVNRERGPQELRVREQGGPHRVALVSGAASVLRVVVSGIVIAAVAAIGFFVLQVQVDPDGRQPGGPPVGIFPDGIVQPRRRPIVRQAGTLWKLQNYVSAPNRAV